MLLVVGDGAERSASRGCQRKPFVLFLGLQFGDTLKRLYASAGVFVFASRSTRWGWSTWKRCPAACRCGAGRRMHRRVRHPRLSAECYELGAAGLAAAIGRVLDNPLRAQRLAAEGRKAMMDRWEGASGSRLWPPMTQPQ